MPEHPAHDDELAALHDADPADMAEMGDVPSPTGPEGVALFERITMADTSPSSDGKAPQPPGRRAALAVSAAFVVVLAVAAGAFALGRDDGSARDDTLGDRSAPVTDAPGTSAPVTPGGPSSASCVELYDLATLTRRETAFDGTVTSVDGDEVTLTVNRWYAGDAGDEVTLRGASTLAGTTSVGDALSLEPGTRLLVAGDGGFAWSCGFTQPYNATAAREWGDAFAG